MGGAGAGSGTITSSLAASAAVFSADAHKSMLNAIDGCGGLGIGGGAPELVTGGHDGCVRVWDPRVPEPVVSLEPAAGETARDCWSVAFGNSFDEERCVAACYDNGGASVHPCILRLLAITKRLPAMGVLLGIGRDVFPRRSPDFRHFGPVGPLSLRLFADVKLFDLRTQTMRWETNVGNGVVSLEFDRKDIAMNKLVATVSSPYLSHNLSPAHDFANPGSMLLHAAPCCSMLLLPSSYVRCPVAIAVQMLEGKFRVFDMRTRHPTEGYAHSTERAHKATVWMAKHVPQNRDLFMTTGGNGEPCSSGGWCDAFALRCVAMRCGRFRRCALRGDAAGSYPIILVCPPSLLSCAGGLNVYKYHYPDKRAEKDSEGHMRGVMGRTELLNARIVSSQPIVGFDWHPDKEGLACAVSLDQQVRVLIVTKLEKY